MYCEPSLSEMAKAILASQLLSSCQTTSGCSPKLTSLLSALGIIHPGWSGMEGFAGIKMVLHEDRLTWTSMGGHSHEHRGREHISVSLVDG